MMFDTEYTVVSLREGIWAIETAVLRLFVIAGTERALLINTGVGGFDCNALALELTGLPLDAVILNSHDDHCGGSGYFREIWLHPRELPGFQEHTLSEYVVPRMVPDGHIFSLGGRTVEAVHIPGYTDGSLAMLCVEERILFAGDAISDYPVVMSPRKETYNLKSYVESMDRLSALSDRFDVIFPDHGKLPLTADRIEDLSACLRGILEGSIQGETSSFSPCSVIPEIKGELFRWGRASILFSKPSNGPRYLKQ